MWAPFFSTEKTPASLVVGGASATIAKDGDAIAATAFSTERAATLACAISGSTAVSIYEAAPAEPFSVFVNPLRLKAPAKSDLQITKGYREISVEIGGDRGAGQEPEPLVGDGTSALPQRVGVAPPRDRRGVNGLNFCGAWSTTVYGTARPINPSKVANGAWSDEAPSTLVVSHEGRFITAGLWGMGSAMASEMGTREITFGRGCTAISSASV